ncbi:MAG: hypothetical protein RH917_01885 [Lacipirellulaceae bacterium]
MPDQATQLRRLIRDVKANASPRVALPPLVAVASAQEKVDTAEIAFELAAALAAMHRRVLLVGADASYCRPNVNAFLSIAAVSETKNLLQLHEAGHLPVSENTEMILVDAEDLAEAHWIRHARQIVIAIPPSSRAVVESYTCVKKLSNAGVVNHEKIRPVLSDYVPRTVASKLLKQFDSTCKQFLNLRVADGFVLAGVDRQQTLQASAALAHELAIECLATNVSFRQVSQHRRNPACRRVGST